MKGRLRARALASACLLVVLGGSVVTTDAPVADAAMRGEAQRVRELLAGGAEVNAAQGDGMTALHWAAERNDAEIAEILLHAGARVGVRTRIGGYTPLLVASRKGHAEVMRLLVAAGADVTARTTTGGTAALHFAAAAGNAAAVELLLRHGADVDARDGASGHTPLMFAAANDREDAVRVLLAHGADVSLTNSTIEDVGALAREESQLHNLRNERVTQVRAYQARERDVLEGQPQAGGAQQQLAAREEAPRQEAARDDAPARPREEGAPPEAAQGEARQAARDAAETAPQGEVARTPREGAQPSQREQDRSQQAQDQEEDDPVPRGYAETVGGYGGFTALHLAARQGNAEVVEALLEAGADIDQPSEGDRTTPILMAAINGHWDLTMSLLERGADPNIPADNGMTPLYAVINLQWAPQAFYPQPQAQHRQQTDYMTAMEKLLEAGADPNARLRYHPWYMVYNFNLLSVDTRGATPFWRAAYGLDVRAMELLVRYGADPHVATRAPAQGGGRGGGGGGGDEDGRGGGDPSGLPPVPAGAPSVTALHAATGAGYGLGRAGNQHRHVPGGWMRAVRYLVEEHGLDVNARDHQGYTALHNAASRGDTELITYLVEKGADVTVVSRRGQTTADMANGPVQRISPFPEAIRLLEQLGSKNNNNCVSC